MRKKNLQRCYFRTVSKKLQSGNIKKSPNPLYFRFTFLFRTFVPKINQVASCSERKKYLGCNYGRKKKPREKSRMQTFFTFPSKLLPFTCHFSGEKRKRFERVNNILGQVSAGKRDKSWSNEAPSCGVISLMAAESKWPILFGFPVAILAAAAEGEAPAAADVCGIGPRLFGSGFKPGSFCPANWFCCWSLFPDGIMPLPLFGHIFFRLRSGWLLPSQKSSGDHR